MVQNKQLEYLQPLLESLPESHPRHDLGPTGYLFSVSMQLVSNNYQQCKKLGVRNVAVLTAP